MSSETMPDGQLCDRYFKIPDYPEYALLRALRGDRCTRRAEAKDANGEWACSVHLKVDKKAEEFHERGVEQRRKNALAHFGKRK